MPWSTRSGGTSPRRDARCPDSRRSAREGTQRAAGQERVGERRLPPRLPPRHGRGRRWGRPRWAQRAGSARATPAPPRAPPAGSAARRATVGLPDRHRRRDDDGEPVVRPLPRLARRRRALPGARSLALREEVHRRRQDRHDLRRRGRQAPPHPPPRPGWCRAAPVPRLWAPDPGARLVRGPRRAGRWLPRRGLGERPVRARLLPRRGRPGARPHGPALHRARPFVRLVVRRHVPEPAVRVHRAVQR